MTNTNRRGYDATAHHFPPDLFDLLVQAIARLFRGKRQVVGFFQGAGVPDKIMADLAEIVRTNPASIYKHEISRTVLERLNAAGDATWALRARREVVKRMVEVEDFSSCWPGDRAEAENLVGRVRRVVNVKDSFTRMAQREERSAQAKINQHAKALRAEEVTRKKMADVQSRLTALFNERDPHERGKALEGVLNDLFDAGGILVEEAFVVHDENGRRAVEQIDGAIRLDGHIYLVEMKWLKDPVGPHDAAQHLVRVHSRAEARGLFIAASRFTDAAVDQHRGALPSRVVVMCGLDEIVRLLELQADVGRLVRDKVDAAQLHKNPYHRPLG
ncbi:MAG: restriction endonuclease [Mycobacteriales bacterium]